jgi:cellulose synthase/poly-beta-1,6-N-acetylglucosamine synthase-like glycosyltransferase
LIRGGKTSCKTKEVFVFWLINLSVHQRLAAFLLYIFLISLLIQLVFFLLIFSRLAFFRQKKSTSKEFKGVSVIVAAHNEIENLKKLISTLLNQNYPDFEIILADDRSEDGIEDFTRKNFRDPRLKFIRIDKVDEGANPKKNALSRAIDLSSKEIILLTDADCMPLSNEWISRMTAQIHEGKEIVLGYSQYEQKPGLLNLLIRYETFYTAVQYFSFALAGNPYMGVGRNLCYLKKSFLKNKGFEGHRNITGGDDDLFIRDISKKDNVGICLGKASQTVSIPESNFASWLRQKRRHLSVGKHYKVKDRLILGLLSISQLFLWISIFALIIFQIHTDFIIIAFILRTSVFIAIFIPILNKLEDNIKWYALPFLDLLYVVYYMAAGLMALSSRNIRWT